MADPADVSFPDHQPVLWSPSLKGVRFYGVQGSHAYSCFVPGNLLVTRFGADTLDPDECIQAYRSNRAAIQNVARQKILNSQYGGAGRVDLAESDFPPLTTQPPTVPRVAAVYNPAFAQKPRLKQLAEQVTRRLEHDVIPPPFRVGADWGLFVSPPDTLISLTLRDSETGAESAFLFPEGYLATDMQSTGGLRFFWDQLLRERAKRQADTLQTADAAEG